MKIVLTFKDPDHAVQVDGRDVGSLPREARALVREYVEFAEYITVEFDTATGDVRVVPINEGGTP